jgi:hypothetical protein
LLQLCQVEDFRERFDEHSGWQPLLNSLKSKHFNVRASATRIILHLSELDKYQTKLIEAGAISRFAFNSHLSAPSIPNPPLAMHQSENSPDENLP